MLAALIQAVLALDETLALLAAEHGRWLYVLFAVIFAETGSSYSHAPRRLAAVRLERSSPAPRATSMSWSC